MTRLLLTSGAVLGALAVLSGAFGAHALQGMLGERALGWYDTAVTYHARHSLALLACGILGTLGYHGRSLSVAGLCLLAGTLVFAGSLYTMAFTGLTWLGAITPIGGVLLIVGWSALVISVWRGPPFGARRTHREP